MEDGKHNILRPQSYAMNGGNGPYSYAENSFYQRGIVESTKETIKEAIAKNLETEQYASSTSSNPIIIRIADFGCSTGPNTFLAIQNIVEAVELTLKLKTANSRKPDFQVFFNDQISNDFNTLFASLPSDRQYYVAGVPGSFYGILFPKASLDFAYSSCSLHWLSKVPEEVTDENSQAWNKGKIHYTNAHKEVLEAYSAQFDRDIESYLNARAQELVGGGLLAILIPGLPDVILESDITTGTEFEVLGSCLMDMAKTGLVSEQKVDSFNLPIYYTSSKELTALIERNGYFTIEQMETFNPRKHVALHNVKMRALYFRAVFEGLLEKHYGNGIMDELFDRYSKKVAVSSFYLNPENHRSVILFALLKRNVKC